MKERHSCTPMRLARAYRKDSSKRDTAVPQGASLPHSLFYNKKKGGTLNTKELTTPNRQASYTGLGAATPDPLRS
jgi:hypothetical protein